MSSGLKEFYCVYIAEPYIPTLYLLMDILCYKTKTWIPWLKIVDFVFEEWHCWMSDLVQGVSQIFLAMLNGSYMELILNRDILMSDALFTFQAVA